MTTPPTLASLETPIPVVDLDRVDANIDRTASYAHAHGLALRPHVKTHKSAYIAGLQLAAGASGVTCATPREAEAMRTVTDDIMLAYPTVGVGRARRVAALARTARMRVMLDSLEAIDQLADALDPKGPGVGVLIEVDMGMGRVGVPDPASAIALARRVRETRGLEYAGIGFYPGHIRQSPAMQDDALRAVNARLAAMLDALGREGLSPSVVSAGSTPTLWRSHELRGLTEIRPGTSVYNDRTTAAIGVSTLADCALTVLATVVSVSVPGHAIIDAGVKALGREPLRGEGEGYGALLEHPDAIVTAMSEEHGTIDLANTAWRPRVGDRVSVIPNHVCIVTHLFDEAAGVRGGEVERVWEVVRGR